MKKTLLVVFLVMALLVAFTVTASAGEPGSVPAPRTDVTITRDGETSKTVITGEALKFNLELKPSSAYEKVELKIFTGADTTKTLVASDSKENVTANSEITLAANYNAPVTASQPNAPTVLTWELWLKKTNEEAKLAGTNGSGTIKLTVKQPASAPEISLWQKPGNQSSSAVISANKPGEITYTNASDKAVAQTAAIVLAKSTANADYSITSVKVAGANGFTVTPAAVAADNPSWKGFYLNFDKLPAGEHDLKAEIAWKYEKADEPTITDIFTADIKIIVGENTKGLKATHTLQDGSYKAEGVDKDGNLTGTTYTLHVAADQDPVDIKLESTGKSMAISNITNGSISSDTLTLSVGGSAKVKVTATNGASTVYTIQVVGDYDKASLDEITIDGTTITNFLKGTNAVTVRDQEIVISGQYSGAEVAFTAVSDDLKENTLKDKEDGTFSGKLTLKDDVTQTQLTVTVTAVDGAKKDVTIFALNLKTEAPKQGALSTLYVDNTRVSVSSNMTASYPVNATSFKVTPTADAIGTIKSVDVKTNGTISANQGVYTVTPADTTKNTVVEIVVSGEKGAADKVYTLTVSQTSAVSKLTALRFHSSTSSTSGTILDDRRLLTGSSNRRGLDLDEDDNSFYLTPSFTGGDKDKTKLVISGDKDVIMHVSGPNSSGRYAVELYNDWYEEKDLDFTVTYVYDGKTQGTYYYSLSGVEGQGLAKAGISDDEDDKTWSKFDSFKVKSGTTKYAMDVDEDWDDYIYLYLEAESGYEIGTKSVEYSTTDKQSKADTADVEHTIDKNETYVYEIPYDAGEEVYIWVEVEGTGSNKDMTYKFVLNGEASDEMVLDKLVVSDEKNGKGSDYTMIPSDATDGVNDYYVFIPEDDIDEVHIYAEAEDADELWIDGKEVDVDGGSVKVASKATTKSYEVKVVDGKDDYEYTVYVKVGDDKDDDDSDLSDIEIRSGEKSNTTASKRSKVSLSPSFSSSKTSYTAYAGDEYIWVEPTGKDPEWIFVNGELTGSGKTAGPIKLEKGKNTIEVVGVAENCDDMTTYKITVYYQSSVLLQSLSVGSGTMTPAFDAQKTSYTAHVPAGTSSISISAVAQSDDASVSIGSGLYGTGKASGSINLNAGINIVTVMVAEKGVGTSYYTISIYRETANPKVVVSNQKVVVNNGSAQTLTAYNIAGNNFLQLRDLAALLRNTAKSFSLSYNDSTRTASMTTGGNYSLTGLENAALARYKSCVASNQSFILDSKYIYPMAYNVDGANYVMIRDMASAMDFGVTYDSYARTLYVNTGNSYTPGN